MYVCMYVYTQRSYSRVAYNNVAGSKLSQEDSSRRGIESCSAGVLPRKLVDRSGFIN